MTEIETNMPQVAPVPGVTASGGRVSSHQGRKVVAAPVVLPGAAKAKGLEEVVNFMRRLSAFEKHSSQVNFLVR